MQSVALDAASAAVSAAHMPRFVALLLLLAAALPARAQAPVKFTLNFRLDASNAAFFLAEDRGYYAAEGLAVTLDGAKGSADAASRLAGGAYQMGCVDISVITEFNARNPERAIQSLFMVYDLAPMAIGSLRERGIARPADLIGRTVGAAAGDGAYRMFPAFARLNSLDPGQVKIQLLESQLREAMLIRGAVDAVIGFDYVVGPGLIAGGAAPDSIVLLRYSDYGMRLYGNSIAASRSFIDANPEIVRRFVAAAARGWRDTFEDPAAAIDAVVKRDPLLSRDAELERMRWIREHNLRSPEDAKRGLGSVDRDRLAAGIALVAQAFGLPSVPDIDGIYTDRFLPPLPDRTPRP
jgi:NitT/TauT family transport system substrate-binding protein